MKKINVPTGKIIIVNGQKGKLECLSIGDYGKAKNIKADFMGMTEEINGVPNGRIMPLSEKWVVTISTQYGCSMGCSFCDVPLVGKGVNATKKDLVLQVKAALKCYPDIYMTKRLNIHFARMGEPTWNWNVIEFIASGLLSETVSPQLGNSLIHPVISTMLPRKNSNLLRFLETWCSLKNQYYNGNAGLQLSINSTDDIERKEMFNNNALSIVECGELAKRLPPPVGRKYALNFALCDYTINPKILKKTFNPKYFMCKITPMHVTKSCKDKGLLLDGGYDFYYPYKKAEAALKDVGFDVLVFIPSKEEDESRITCGNAILADRKRNA